MRPNPAASHPAADDAAPLLDLAPFRAAPRRDDPYPWVAAEGCLRPEALPALRRDFPTLPRPGYHPAETFTPRGAFAALLAEIEAGALDTAMSEKFDIDVTALPRLVTVRQVSAAHEGRPHTDSASKVATLLLYLHPGWAHPAGRIRVLRGESLADPVAEVSPEEGNVFAFLRGERSWHGHTPFVGERRVVQVAWLRDAAALARKTSRGRLAWWLKGVSALPPDGPDDRTISRKCLWCAHRAREARLKNSKPEFQSPARRKAGLRPIGPDRPQES